MATQISEYAEPQRVLGTLVRGIRRSRGLTGTQLAARTGMSQSKISRIETGATTPTVADIRRIALALSAEPAETDGLVEMTERLQIKFSDHQPSDFGGLQVEISHLEENAGRIRLLQPSLLPGLLQTADYARAVVSSYASNFGADREDVAGVVSVRLKRQGLLHAIGKEVVIVFMEPALWYQYCPPAVMLAQIDRIHALAAQTRAEIRIVPVMAMIELPTGNPVQIFDDELAMIDLANTIVFTRRANDLVLYQRIFDCYYQASTGDIEHILRKATARFIEQLQHHS